MGAAPEQLIIFGCGGHARVVLESALASWPGCAIAVLDDDPQAQARNLLGHEVAGGREWLRSNWPDAAVAPALGGNDARAELIAWLAQVGRPLATIIHPSAVVSPSATLAGGSFVAPGAVVNAQSRIGIGAIVNTSASIDHDCVIGDSAHIGPGAHLCGGVTVGERTLVGVGTSVVPGVTIGARVTIGAGSSVIGDIADGARVAGCPARPLRF